MYTWLMRLYGIKSFLKLSAACVAFFAAARLVFFLYFGLLRHEAAGMGLGETVTAFLTGARLDISLAAMPVLIPLALVYLAGWFLPAQRERMNKGLFLYYSACAVTALFFLCAEFPFYLEYGSRLNHLFFEYMTNPRELAVTLSGVKAVFPALAAFAVLAWLTVKGVKTVCRKSLVFGEEGWGLRIASFLLIVFFAITGLRGGLQRRPINWGAAFFSRDNFANQTALNGIFNLYQHFQIFMEERGGDAKPQQYMEDGKALAEIQAFNAGGDDAPDDIFLPGEKPEKPNIIFIFMESFGAKYCGILGSSEPCSPNFDALAKSQGVFFSRFYSNGTRTSRGLTAALCSFPPLPGVNLTKKIEAQQPMNSVAHYLGQAGYKTMFFYGGDRHFEDMSGFFMKTGFDRFYDFTDFKDIKYRNPIGVYDEELFENADRIISETGEPFVAAIMTLTNHGPFTLPDNWKDRDPGLPKEMRTYKYSDWALSRFMEMASKRPWYNNTIFLIMGDHGAFLGGFSADRFHIPLLIFSPRMKRAATDTRLASQLDIPPTVLKLCGLESRGKPFWGQPLFAKASRPGAFLLDDPYFGFVGEKGLYRESLTGARGGDLFGRDMNPVMDASTENEYAALSRAYLQLSQKIFLKGKAEAGMDGLSNASEQPDNKKP